MIDFPIVVYDDVWCKIEITPANFPGCYFVTLNDDQEASQACVSLDEAKDVTEEMREAFLEDNGQLGRKMSKFWDLVNPEDPFASTENFGPMLPNGRNACGMTKDEIYFAIHGKTQRQVQKEMEDVDTD